MIGSHILAILNTWIGDEDYIMMVNGVYFLGKSTGEGEFWCVKKLMVVKWNCLWIGPEQLDFISCP